MHTDPFGVTAHHLGPKWPMSPRFTSPLHQPTTKTIYSRQPGRAEDARDLRREAVEIIIVLVSQTMAFIIRDVRVFDGEKVLEDGRVYVQDGIIREVGPDVDVSGVAVISMPGHTLLPGLIDSHCHPYRQSNLPEQAFRFGITTIMDMHNLHDNAVIQKQWARERSDYPDVKSCHFAATINDGWPAWVEKKLNNNEVGASYRRSWPSYHDTDSNN